MNYIKHYSKLVNRAKKRTLPEDTYTEEHHILPKCRYPEYRTCKWNLVRLLPEEHLIAHLLLHKIYPDSYGLLNAVVNMSGRVNGKRRLVSKNKSYGWLRKKFSESQKGKIMSDESRIKMSEAAKNRPPPSMETKRKMSEVMKGRVFTDDWKKNLSEAQKGKSVSEETKQKIREARKKQAPIGEEGRRKLSEASKGRKHKQETKDYLKKVQTEIHLKKSGKYYKLIEPNGTEHISFGLVALRNCVENNGLCFRMIERMIYNGYQPKRGRHFGWSCVVFTPD